MVILVDHGEQTKEQGRRLEDGETVQVRSEHVIYDASATRMSM